MKDELGRQETIDRCIERLLDGEPLDDVLASYPGQGAELLPLLEAAGALVRAPSPQPSPAARSLAMSRMLAQVATEAQRPQASGVFSWLGTMRARPLAFQAIAVAGAVVLFAGLGIGASAATGTTPEPVRTLFRIPDDSSKSVHVSGAVLSASEGSLVIETGSGQQVIALGASTVLKRADERIAWGDLRAGERVEVSGSERDGQIIAKQVRAQPLPGTTSTAPATQPTREGTRGAEDAGRTETPHEDRTPEERGGGDDDRTPEPPEASATADDHDATPEATNSPEHADDKTPEATKPPEEEHQGSGTPEPTETPEAAQTASSLPPTPEPNDGG